MNTPGHGSLTVVPNPLKQPPPVTGRPRPVHAPHRTLADLADAVPGAQITGAQDAGAASAGGASASGPVLVTGLTHDSRAVLPGDLYAAMAGATVHGAEFAAQAAEHGAVAILTDHEGAARAAATGLPVIVVPSVRPMLGPIAARLYGEPATHLRMLGITGTNGKTTSSYLVEGGLKGAAGYRGVIGTVEMRVGTERIKSERTTPEATDLHAILAMMRERGADAVVMEVSSHALAYGRTAGIRYAVAAFTNLTQDHLDFHADIEDYFEAKAKLFTPGYTEFSVINTDDPYGLRIAQRLTDADLPHWTYSPSGAASAHWRAEQVEPAAEGSRFTLVGPDDLRLDAAVQLPGGFNVSNAMAAVITLIATGVDPETAVAGVASVPGVPGRMQRIDVGQQYLAVVDYAHTPDAIDTLLAALRPVTTVGYVSSSAVVATGTGASGRLWARRRRAAPTR